MSEESAEAAVSENERNMAVFRAGYVGIATNIALAGVKAFIGLAANSISVVLDAVNNLSDAVSSVVTIIGNRVGGCFSITPLTTPYVRIRIRRFQLE